MDWTRKELKENAKALLKNIYWKAVLVALVLSAISGGAGASSSSRTSSELTEEDKQEILQGIDKLFGTNLNDVYNDDYDYNEYNFEDYNFDSNVNYDIEDVVYSSENTTMINTSDKLDKDLAAIGMIIGVVGIVVLIVVVTSSLLNFLVFKPLVVGCKKFFANADRGEEELGDMGCCFKSGVWGNTCKVMFLQALYISLWTLLFIIPGIVKAYEYMMVPYIVADHPDWTSAEIFAKSKEMMTGNKWKAFVLKLSFIGWKLLAIFTVGLLNIFYVNPYYDLTEAQLYATLKNVYDREYELEMTY